LKRSRCGAGGSRQFLAAAVDSQRRDVRKRASHAATHQNSWLRVAGRVTAGRGDTAAECARLEAEVLGTSALLDIENPQPARYERFTAAAALPTTDL
jgi:hypothetical protein